MTFQTNADRDLRMSPAEREKARRDDNDTQRVKQAVDAARIEQMKNPEKAVGEVFTLDTPQKPGDAGDGVMDGIIATQALIDRTDYSTATDPVLPILKAIPNPGWWWTGRFQFVMSAGQWDAYLSGHWCMRCRNAHAEAFPERCDTCLFTRTASENAVRDLERMAEIAWAKQRGIELVPAGAIPAGQLKGLKPINTNTNTRGAA